MTYRSFFVDLAKETIKDDVPAIASELTYKILLAFFPFLIFLMSLIGYLKLDESLFMSQMLSLFPKEIADVLSNFVSEVVVGGKATVLSISLLVSVWSASSGFRGVIKGVRMSFGRNEGGLVRTYALSVFFVVLFATTLVTMLLLMIFNNAIFRFLRGSALLSGGAASLYSLLGTFLSMAVMLFSLMLIYKFSIPFRTGLRQVMPGALFSVAAWVIISKVFNIYVNNFARYSRVYGSIAGVFILILWLNIISLTLLIGSEINSVLIKHDERQAAKCGAEI
ncbi:MAG: YihY/virulence factor BrkB family protein [Firmicutes bacterium]|nr:YihY/virulence factor BrkB family protein [Bacillota bacterium]